MLSVCLTNLAVRLAGLWRVAVWIQVSLTSALVGGEWAGSRPGHFTPWTHWIGPLDGTTGPRTPIHFAVHPVDSRSTDCTTAYPKYAFIHRKYILPAVVSDACAKVLLTTERSTEQFYWLHFIAQCLKCTKTSYALKDVIQVSLLQMLHGVLAPVTCHRTLPCSTARNVLRVDGFASVL
jgi:hypothetical protein